MESTDFDLFGIPDIYSDDEIEKNERIKRKQENAEFYAEKYITSKNGILSEEKLLENFLEKKKALRKVQRSKKTKQFAEKVKEFNSKEEKEEWIKSVQKEKFERQEKMKIDKEKGTKVVFDCSFEGVMGEKEIKSAALQIKQCYSTIKTSDASISLNVTSADKQIMSNIGNFGSVNWHANFYKESFNDLLNIEKSGFNREDVIYLSPDAEESIYEFDPKKTYVIGAIVDAHIISNQTKTKAEDYGVKAYKLPLKEFRINNNFRTSLNISTVFEIVNNAQIHKDIMKAIGMSLPNRYKKVLYDKEKGHHINYEKDN